MSSAGYQQWVDAGRPDSGLALPLTQLADTLTAQGWLVYRWPDDSHLLADPPEDHTQFSATGWPGPSPRWWRHAIDIMPDGKGPEALYDLGERMFQDRQAGLIPWLKYLNRPDVRGSLATARQDAWESSHVQRRSSDVGHIHASSITGVETLSSPYNPFGGPTSTEDDVSQFLAQQTGPEAAAAGSTYPDGSVFLCDGITSWYLTAEAYAHTLTLVGENLLKLTNQRDAKGGIIIRSGWFPGIPFGAFPAAPAPTVDDIVNGIKAALPPVTATGGGASGLTVDQVETAVEAGVRAVFHAA